MLACLLEAARLIEDNGGYPLVPQYSHHSEAWRMHKRQSSPSPSPMPSDPFEDADDFAVPRADEDSPKPRCPETHNEVEKRRRAYLTQCYVELQEVVPAVAEVKASNVTVLTEASDYIHELQQQEKALIKAKEAELHRRATLLARLSAARAGSSASLSPVASTGYAESYAESCADSTEVADGPALSVSSSEPGDETETDEEGVVPDPSSRCASPRAPVVEGLTELTAAMAGATRKQKTRGLRDTTNRGNRERRSSSPAAKRSVAQPRRTSRPVKRKMWHV